MSKSVRLNKALADAGLCSRRKADELIGSGVVLVNGQKAETGMKIDPEKDVVSVRGQRLALATSADVPLYLMLNKPVQIVSTAKDPEGRTTVLDLLPKVYTDKRLYPVGRLDYFSEGLLLLCNDGELTQRLTHPRYHVPRVYEVRLRQRPGSEALMAMRSGMRLAEGEKLAPVEVEALDSSGDGALLRMTLHQGVNRQIRRMCRDLALTILVLRRVALGPLTLGDLGKGLCRPLDANELVALKKAVGLVS
ncbi:rRNA pseudouridine synthase [Desulfovibrio sp. OttesenSCG-928-F20]|nr:rRNA pseudouridine synthase [Desulfovibrio sp. OttesenSCG-928-F20]